MSQLEVTNVLYHGSLSHEFRPGVTLVTGKNTSGKSSLAKIIGALVTHDANPGHVSAAATKDYVTDGALEGQARLDDVVWRPPAGISSPPDQGPLSTPQAAGLIDFRVNRVVKQRAELWEGLFLPSDPMAILRPRWQLPEAQLVAVVEIINTQGWEKASGIYEDRRREAKRRWQQITGARLYGKRVASTWTPKNWREELEGKSEADLQSEVVDLRDRLQALGVRQTIEQSRIDEANRVLAEDIPAAERDLSDAQTQYRAASADYQAHRKHLTEMQDLRESHKRELSRLTQILEAKAPYECPHCQKGLQLSAGQVVAWEAPSGAEIEKATTDRDTFMGNLAEVEAELGVQGQAMDGVSAEVNTAAGRVSQIQGRLDELRRRAEVAGMEVSQVDEGERAKLELDVEEANKFLVAHQQYYNAKREHDNVVELDTVCTLLGPTGARAQHMRQAMDKVRLVLANGSKRAGWLPITILDDYGLTSNGRSLPLVSDNEKLKAQWLCQVAAVMLAGGSWVVLDAADLLRDESWDGLVELVNSLASKREGLHIVVCATSTECPPEWDHVRLGA